MSTDVSSLVTATYTATVPVFADADLMNSAGFVDMIVACLNRTEFVKQNVPGISDVVPNVVSRIEEFMAIDWNSSRNMLNADLNWKTAFNGSPIVTCLDGITNNPGGISVELATATHSFSAFLGSQSTSNPLQFAQFARCAFIVANATTAANRDARYGLSQDSNLLTGGTYGAAFVQLEASANWQIKMKTTGGEDTIDTGVLISADTIYQLEIIRNSGGSLTFKINNSAIGTYSSPSNKVLTTEAVNLGLLQIGKISASRIFKCRHMSFRTSALSNRF